MPSDAAVRSRRRPALDIPPLRHITDPRSIRALAHPVRIALIEVLSFYGPMTATAAGERIGETPTTCSFHLRQLAKYGFVEEAGGGRGRARPWKMTTIGMRISSEEDDESEIATATVMRLLRERWLARYETWLETRGSYPKHWRKALGESQTVAWMTLEEAEAMHRDLLEVLMRYHVRLSRPSTRPAGSLPVELLCFSYPVSALGAIDDTGSASGRIVGGSSGPVAETASDHAHEASRERSTPRQGTPGPKAR